MERDELGICLSRQMLRENLDSTFTHVRAYELEHSYCDDSHVAFVFPQMQGRDVLQSIQCNKRLMWRADFYCPNCFK
jgi:hypothetical protein